MAVSGTVPARRQPRFDPRRLASWIRRVTLVATVGLGLWCYLCYGTEWVPPGMRTVPEIVPGSLCLVDRRASAAQVGRNVFVRAGGITLLTRVAAIEGGRLTVANPDPKAPFPDSRAFGPVAPDQLLGTVLIVFAPDGEEPRRGG